MVALSVCAAPANGFDKNEEGGHTAAMKTVDVLFEETGLTLDDVAERANLSNERVEAIIVAAGLPARQSVKKSPSPSTSR